MKATESNSVSEEGVGGEGKSQSRVVIWNCEADTDEGEARQTKDLVEFSQRVRDADFAEENGLDCFHVESFCDFVVTRIEHQVEHDDLERDLLWVDVVGDGHFIFRSIISLFFDIKCVVFEIFPLKKIKALFFFFFFFNEF